MSLAQIAALGFIAGATIFIGLPIGRLRSVGPASRAFLTSECRYAASVARVRTKPGLTLLQRIPCTPSSIAVDSVSARSAALLAP